MADDLDVVTSIDGADHSDEQCFKCCHAFGERDKLKRCVSLRRPRALPLLHNMAGPVTEGQISAHETSPTPKTNPSR